MQLDEQLSQANSVIAEAFDRFQRLSLAWTGGKDSTVLLWLIRQYCQEHQIPLPDIVFINEGDPFEEVLKFVDTLSTEWGFAVTTVQNQDVLDLVTNIGNTVRVTDLSPENQAAVAEIGFTEKTFPFEPESLVGNHLMKTVPLRQFIQESGTEALFVGVRWDEHEARSQDSFFREITEPPHTRVEPILPFIEADIWALIKQENIPTVSLYEQGYRSLGVKSTTTKSDQKPAWEQDLATTTERSGRRQDKEKIMQRLRSLGYM